MRIFLLLLAAAMCWQADAAVRKRKVRRNPDTLAVPLRAPEMPVSRKMNEAPSRSHTVIAATQMIA